MVVHRILRMNTEVVHHCGHVYYDFRNILRNILREVQGRLVSVYP